MMSGNKYGTAGIILAGGQSSRFGSPKALVNIQGVSIIQRISQVIRAITSKNVVIASESISQAIVSPLDDIICDREEVKGRGPLAGIYTGMEYIQAEFYIVAACDLPGLKTEMFSLLYQAIIEENADAAVPVCNGKIHPLCGIYHNLSLPFIKMEVMHGKGKVMNVLQYIRTVYVEMDNFFSPDIFRNMNTEEDYEAYLKEAGRDRIQP